MRRGIHDVETMAGFVGAGVERDQRRDAGRVDALNPAQVERHALAARQWGEPSQHVLLIAPNQLGQLGQFDQSSQLSGWKHCGVCQIWTRAGHMKTSMRSQGANRESRLIHQDRTFADWVA